MTRTILITFRRWRPISSCRCFIRMRSEAIDLYLSESPCSYQLKFDLKVGSNGLAPSRDLCLIYVIYDLFGPCPHLLSGGQSNYFCAANLRIGVTKHRDSSQLYVVSL